MVDADLLVLQQKGIRMRHEDSGEEEMSKIRHVLFNSPFPAEQLGEVFT